MIEAGKLFEVIQHVVFWCSIASLVGAIVEKWVNKWIPNHAYWVSAIVDLISQFGALNFRDKIVNGGKPTPVPKP